MKKFGFIGFGLIGGSVARAIRKLYPKAQITAYNYYKNRPHPRLNAALADGVLSGVTIDFNDFSTCDAIFLCAPVRTNVEYLEKIAPYLSPNCMITDVGSVKNDIVKAIRKLGLTKQFVGGHPMTGSEKIGYEYSSEKFFVNKYYILTPMEDSNPAHIDWMKQFVKNIQSYLMILEPEKHDAVVAGISHVPHVLSASLVNAVSERDIDGTYGLLAAGGFHSVTRISSSSPDMWQSICMSNSKEIIDFLEAFEDKIHDFKEKIKNKDEEGLYEAFLNAKKYRDHILE